MKFEIQHLFDPERKRQSAEERHQALFDRAYYEDRGPFYRVITRLRAGFSVLVYLPGNCMAAAAGLVKSKLDSRNWDEYGEHPGEGESIVTVWTNASGIIGQWKKWLSEKEGKPPGAIFHNLDFLSDGRGGLYQHPEAQTAVACLVGGTRSNVVLGLSDRDAGSLPEAIVRAFNEQERIDEIPFENFHRIIPVSLGDKLQRQDGTVPDGTVWILASRLRWSDPIRAYQIMQEAAQGQANLTGVLSKILEATQTVNFLSPNEVYSGAEPQGFQSQTVSILRNNIIRPFQEWSRFQGDLEDCLNGLKKLPPGLILHGPPGTGKTLLARWIAQSIGLPVRTVSGSEIRAGLWGDAEKNVRNLFRDARRAAPCVLILDDADDLLPDRNAVQGGVASSERAVVNEFLQQLQGVHGRLEGVLVILTTNRFKDLDKAAKERLALHLRIPYPLTIKQVGDIVDGIAREYNFNLSEIREVLIQHFYKPVVPRAVENRLTADSNLFSPREVQQAMRLLEGWSSDHQLGQRYTPTLEDFERMNSYYKQGAAAVPQ